MQLTEEEVHLIRTSFLELSADLQRSGDIFYERLFERAPETRELFVQDISVQTSKLMSTLGLVVSQLQNTKELQPIVEDLAIRHLAYGVTVEHYDFVREALLDMLQTVLNLSRTSKPISAWARAFDQLATTMISAAYVDRKRSLNSTWRHRPD